MEKLKVLSLFSGVGMFDFGLEKAGMETVGFCEVDLHCQNILRKHWPNTFIATDIKDLRKVDIACNEFEDALNDLLNNIDVVTASWPCQNHSVAGNKRGLEGAKSGLWKEVKRVLQETNASWFIGENSANLRTTGLTEVLQDLWEIGFHNIRWDILPSESYGTIHKRERIFISANRHSIRLDEQTFAPSKEEQIRRAEAWTTFSNRKCPQPEFYRMDDEHPSRLDESERKQRVKQCGNSLNHRIIEYIGNYILNKEGLK